MIAVVYFAAIGFFAPKIRVDSGRTLKVIGSGPPVVFSTGLFGTIPHHVYNDVINNVKKNISVVVFDDMSPISKRDVEDAADALQVEKVGFMSHSALDLNILNSERIHKALLHDPITIPKASLSGIESATVVPKSKVMVVRAENTMNGKVPIPEYNFPLIEGQYDVVMDMNVGHADILDNTWQGIASRVPLWSTNIDKSSFISYENWNNLLPQDKKGLKEYKNLISERIKKTFSVKKKILPFLKKENPDKYN